MSCDFVVVVVAGTVIPFITTAWTEAHRSGRQIWLTKSNHKLLSIGVQTLGAYDIHKGVWETH